MERNEAGEAACFLSELDDNGMVPDPRRLVQVVNAAQESAGRLVTIASGDQLPQVLRPRAEEDPVEYRRRLEAVAERSAAWRLALSALDRPLVLVADSAERGYLEVLAEYLWSLLA